MKIELASVASTLRRVIRGALSHGINTSVVVQDKVGERDIGGITQATATSIRRIASRNASP